jgi:putative ABC transport system ATP-binding protein
MQPPKLSNNPAVIATQLGKTVTTTEQSLTILSAINFSINAGDTVAIIGESGSGKSTLLGLLAGLDTPTTGSVVLAGHDLTRLDEEARTRLRSEQVGFVFQSFQLLPGMTALENVMLPLELRNQPGARAEARRLLERVGLGSRLQHTPRQLSGGEQQRVALARAFVTRPAILFADEPTGNLDRQTGARISDILFELNAEQATTLILVTHDASLAARCNRTIQLVAGVMA